MIEEFDDMNPKEIEDLLGFVDTIDDGDDINYDLLMETLGIDFRVLGEEMENYTPQIEVEYRKSNEDSIDPKYAYESDSGFDLYSVDEHWLKIETLALKLIEKEIVESDELATIVGDQKIVSMIPDSL